MGNRWTLNDEHLNVDKYLRACVNLYGHVTPRQFLKLYNRYNTQKINKEKYLLWMEKLQRNSYEYYTLYANAIINSKVPNKKIDEIIYYQNGKKYYEPSEAELLVYANPKYYEQNEYVNEMLDFLINNMKLNRLVAEDFISKLVWIIKIEDLHNGEFDLLEKIGFTFENMDQLNGYIMRLQNLSNNTRKWANCGYTPKELFYHKANKAK